MSKELKLPMDVTIYKTGDGGYIMLPTLKAIIPPGTKIRMLATK